MDKRKLAVASGSAIILLSLVAYAAIQYFGQVGVVVPVEQAVWIDGKRYNETITETLPMTYGGCTVYANHTLENKGSDGAKVKFVKINITDSQGNLVTDNSVTVSWLIDGNPVVQPITIAGHTTVEFSIVIHFHYAVMPDTYTINIQVQPHI